MKRFFTLISVPTLLLATALPSFGSEPLLSFDFEDESTFNNDFSVKDGNEDNVKWQWANYSSGSRVYHYAKCSKWNATAYNDLMTVKTPCHLEAGHAYILKFQGWAEDSETPQATTIAVGYYPSGEEEDIIPIFSKNKLTYINKYQGETPEEFEAAFEVEETGDYFITFMAVGGAGGGVSVDNITLTDGGSPLTPLPASSLSAEAASDFSLSATLAITLPVKTLTGSSLPADGISKVEIYRGESLAGIITSGLTPGETVNWTDANAVAGINEYKVIVYNGDLSSGVVETTVYVGPMTPLAPTSVKAAKGGAGKINITWSAPASSVEEQPLKPELITFNVYRSVNDADFVAVATNLANTEYEDTYNSDDSATLVYQIEAQYSGRKSEVTVSNSVKVGTYSLPFEESFADAFLPEDWEITTTDNSYSPKMWEVRAQSASSPYAKPWDEDGGLLTYNSFSANSNLESQAITPSIKLNGANSPVLEFMFYHNNQYGSYNDRVVIEVSQDGSAFEELDMDPITRYGDKSEWKQYQIPLAAYRDADEIRVSFKAISGRGADMAIDAVRIFNGKSNDLEAGALTAINTEVNTGEEAEFKFTVKNVAFGDVSGEDYTVKTYLGNELLSELPGQDVNAMGSVDFTFAVTTHAGHVEAGVPVYAVIDFEADEDESNNESAQITVSVKGYEGENISDLNGVLEGNTLRLNWSVVETEDYEPMASEITLDREEDIITKEDYDLDNTIAWPSTFTASDGKVWMNIDKDGLDIPKQYTMPAGKRGFMITSKGMTGNSSHKDFTGNDETGMLVAAAPLHGKGVASDYLISPLIPGKGDHILSFEGKSYSSACTADFIVEYSTDSEFSADNLEEKFVPVADKVHIANNYQEGGKWNSYSYRIPSDAKYVAIHFVGEGGVTYDYDYWTYETTEIEISSVVCLDNIKLTSAPISKPTYNVYYREIGSGEEEVVTFDLASSKKAAKKHNATPIEEGEYVLSAPSVATDYHVSAVYPQGETSLSTPFRLDVVSGVESVAVESGVSVKAEGRTFSAYSPGEEIPVTVYASDGTVLAIDAYGFTVAAPGAYIVKAADKTVTIVVR